MGSFEIKPLILTVHFSCHTELPFTEMSLVCYVDSSWSYIGNQAETVDPKAHTMELNLTQKGAIGDSYLRWTVLHETGHALGFGHEHQHPHMADFFIEEIVIEDLSKQLFSSKAEATEFFNINYKYREDDIKADAKVYPFDKESIMRYWYASIVSRLLKESRQQLVILVGGNFGSQCQEIWGYQS